MSEEKDWIDDVLDDKPIAWWQISKIEGLCQTSSVGDNYVNMNLEEYNKKKRKEYYTNLILSILIYIIVGILISKFI